MLDTPAAAAAAANTTRFRDKWRVTYHHRPTQEHLSFSVVGAPTAPGKLGDLQMQPLHSSSSLRCFSGSPQHSLNTHHQPPPPAPKPQYLRLPPTSPTLVHAVGAPLSARGKLHVGDGTRNGLLLCFRILLRRQGGAHGIHQIFFQRDHLQDPNRRDLERHIRCPH